MFFFHAYITIFTIKKKQGKSPFASNESYSFTRQTSGILQLLESRPSQLLLSSAPFLEKGPPKITEGAPLGPYWDPSSPDGMYNPKPDSE